MSRHRIGYSLAVLFLLLAIAVPLEYTHRHSMLVAGSYVAGNPALEPRVLIATQGSSFKDAVVDRIVADLKPRVGYLKVMDVSELPAIHDNEWTVIVVIHTWEYGKPQADAAAFVNRVADKRKLVVVTTSGGGEQKMPGIDAISAASQMREAPSRADAVMAKVNAILKSSSAGTVSP